MGMGVGAQSVSVGPVIVTGLKDEVGVRRPSDAQSCRRAAGAKSQTSPSPRRLFRSRSLQRGTVDGKERSRKSRWCPVGRAGAHEDSDRCGQTRSRPSRTSPVGLSDIVESFGHTGAPGGMKHSGTGEGTDGQKDDDRDEQGCEPPPCPDDPKLIFHHYHDGTIPCERRGIVEESMPCGRPDQDHCLMARKSTDSRALLGLASP